jgi:hypothetical protein
VADRPSFSSPFYKRCDDPACPFAYAYKSTVRDHDEHFHYIGVPVAEDLTIPGYENDDQIRRLALDEQRLHDPKMQRNGYDRCEHCHFTRHPCSVHELATIVLALLDRGRTDV